MNNLEALKQELVNQKSAVENKGGFVSIAGTNPSPFEITEGINSIPVFDASNATATAEDVLEGKTFYAGDWNIKTGTYQKPQDISLDVVLFFNEDVASIPLNERKDVYFPAHWNKIRNYAFYHNVNPLNIHFHPNTESIGTYCFNGCRNFEYHGLEECELLESILTYAFYMADLNPELYPPNLKRIYKYTFYGSFHNYNSIVLPQGMTTLGDYCFASESSNPTTLLNLDISGFVGTNITPYSFANNIVDSDCHIPNTVTTLESNAFYNVSFRDIYVPASVTKVNTSCFYNSTSSSPAGTRNTNSIVFASTTPPTFGTNVFPTDFLSLPLKIYVPDESVEAYKAVSNLSKYKAIILPISQKP